MVTCLQGNGSEIVHLARHCPNITSLRILLGDKVLRGEMTLHFGQVARLEVQRYFVNFSPQTFFRRLERLTVEGHVHLHGFAFLWGHCHALKYLRIGLVVSNELTNTNVLIMDVFTLLFQVTQHHSPRLQDRVGSPNVTLAVQVNKMTSLEELHIRNLKVVHQLLGSRQ